jgi:glycosyltransferase involved in cell wall biosynthesis
MVTSTYPRFPGDTVGTFMEPIARGVAALGHRVHVVAPWHPEWRRPLSEGGLQFELFRYAPTANLNVFGYAAAMRADVSLRGAAVAVAPLAMISGWHRTRRVIRDAHATIVHAHWVIPSGVIAARAAGKRPLVISLHGSDVFVAERHVLAGLAAQTAFRRASWVTACSADLKDRAIRLGAPPDRTTVVPYGVDSDRFRPDPTARQTVRARLGVDDRMPLVFAFGRLVKKKGFEYLIDAAGLIARERPDVRVLIAGGGDLEAALKTRAAAAGVSEQVQLLGVVPQDQIPELLAAADVAVAPSVHDEAGNVDGLPNAVLEIMASGTALVSTPVGGIAAVATDGVTARIVPEQDPRALADAIAGLLRQSTVRTEIGRQARDRVCRDFSWGRTAERFDEIYEHVLTTPRGRL